MAQAKKVVVIYYLWGQGVPLTNAYKVYFCVQDDARITVSERLTHYEFILSVATDWIDANKIDPNLCIPCFEKFHTVDDVPGSKSHRPPIYFM